MVAVAGMAVLEMTATLAGAQTHPAIYPLTDVMQAPFASDMLAAPTGTAVAWVFNAKGCSNTWLADPSHGAKARRFTPYTEDDGYQPHRLEVWIEKEALAGVFAGVCKKNDVPFLSCRGYRSQSEMWRVAMRLKAQAKKGQQIVVLHFGDHDPSGIDMSRDIEERLGVFGLRLDFHRLALNIAQVDEYQPPPNPVKQTDSRFESYTQRFGDEFWELDALEPAILAGLDEDWVAKFRDPEKW
jgi:hypothetical protein